MYLALDLDGNRIPVWDAEKSQEYVCPVCQGKVIPRQGQVNSWHYAHITACEDSWIYDMSDWHREWQEQFPLATREVVVELQGERHRADFLAYGYVVEFQHSPITAEEFDRRNDFYVRAGYKVVWIFDFIEEYNVNKMTCYDEWHKRNDNGGKYKWLYPKRFLQNFKPSIEKNIIVFFQICEADFGKEQEESYMERVTWAIEYYGITDFKRFCTSYYPGNFQELLDWMENKKL